jgi:hypothetical protein
MKASSSACIDMSGVGQRCVAARGGGGGGGAQCIAPLHATWHTADARTDMS